MSRTPEVYSIFNGLDVNYKVILGIFAGAILFQTGLEFALYDSDVSSDISSAALFLLELGITIFAFYMAYRYNFSSVFGKSFLFFGIGFLALVTGDILTEFDVIPDFVQIMHGAFIPAQSLSYFVLYGGTVIALCLYYVLARKYFQFLFQREQCKSSKSLAR